jgi:hypothetical protein
MRIWNTKQVIHQMNKKAPPCRTVHHFRTPGIASSRSPPPECLFLPPNLIGELFTKVGPLEAGRTKAGVETLLDLQTPSDSKVGGKHTSSWQDYSP